jgi:hypothetical protein
LTGRAALAARKLQGVLDQFKNARPAELDRQFEQSMPRPAPGKQRKQNP